MEILPAGKACGTNAPLYHVKENGKVIGTITIVFRDLVRLYWVESCEESWHDSFGEVCQMIESPEAYAQNMRAAGKLYDEPMGTEDPEEKQINA